MFDFSQTALGTHRIQPAPIDLDPGCFQSSKAGIAEGHIVESNGSVNQMGQHRFTFHK